MHISKVFELLDRSSRISDDLDVIYIGELEIGLKSSFWYLWSLDDLTLVVTLDRKLVASFDMSKQKKRLFRKPIRIRDNENPLWLAFSNTIIRLRAEKKHRIELERQARLDAALERLDRKLASPSPPKEDLPTKERNIKLS